MKYHKMIYEIEKCIKEGKYQEGEELVQQAIKEHQSSVFYNLMGLIKEREGHHVQAIRYFKIAYKLNHSYEPARYNLERYGIFCPIVNCMYSVEKSNQSL